MTITHIGGIDVATLPEAVPHHAEKWYDRKQRVWVVRICDRAGNQIGDAQFIVGQRKAQQEVVRLSADIARAA